MWDVGCESARTVDAGRSQVWSSQRLPIFVTQPVGVHLMNTKLILVALALSLSLAACKKEEAAPTESTEAAVPAEAAPPEAAPAEMPTETPADPAAAGETATAPGEAATEEAPKQ
jgi:hypothetical protein